MHCKVLFHLASGLWHLVYDGPYCLVLRKWAGIERHGSYGAKQLGELSPTAHREAHGGR